MVGHDLRAPSFETKFWWKENKTQLTVFKRARFFKASWIVDPPSSSKAASVGTKKVDETPPDDKSRASLPVITSSIALRNVLFFVLFCFSRLRF